MVVITPPGNSLIFFFFLFLFRTEANSSEVQCLLCQILNKFLGNMLEKGQIDNVLCIKWMKLFLLDCEIKFQTWGYRQSWLFQDLRCMGNDCPMVKGMCYFIDFVWFKCTVVEFFLIKYIIYNKREECVIHAHIPFKDTLFQ